MNSRWLALLIIVILAGVFILRQSNKGKEEESANNTGSDLENILKTDLVEGDEEKVSLKDDKEKNVEIEPVVSPSEPDEAIVYSPSEAGGLTQVEADRLIKGAAADFDAGNLVAGRDKLNKVLLEMKLSYEDQKIVKARLQELSDSWLFSRECLDEDTLVGYLMVKSGDNLEKIGKQHKIPYEFLMRINNIARPEHLRAGKRIKVVNGPFHGVIDLSTYTLDIFLQEQFVKSYKIAIGKPGRETPTGKWCVTNEKLIKPEWPDSETGKVYPPHDPENPLGDRWIGIKGLDDNTKDKEGFALHGTIEPESIGTGASRGCIRLTNEDVVEVFNMLTPVHSLVEIHD